MAVPALGHNEFDSVVPLPGHHNRGGLIIMDAVTHAHFKGARSLSFECYTGIELVQICFAVAAALIAK